MSIAQGYGSTAELQRQVADLTQQLAATIAERDRAVKDAELERAVQRAAKDLPKGWFVQVGVENGAGWVELYDAAANVAAFEEDERTLAQQVDAAIDAAIAAAAGGEEK